MTLTTTTKVTLRSILIGVFLIPFNVYWMTVVEVKYYSLDGSCLPLFIQPVFILFLLISANLLYRHFFPKTALTQAELLTVYIMVAMSCTFAGHDTMQNMFGAIVHPFWFATPENEWQNLFWHHIPRWLTVTDQYTLKSFYEGESSIYLLRNLTVWLRPLFFWGCLFLLMMFAMLCINILVRKRWTEQEKLAYPIIQLPLGLSESAGLKLLRNRVMWVGFTLAFFVGLINGIAYLNPSIPGIPYIKRTPIWDQIFTQRPWNALQGVRISMYPFMIGLAFFLPLDLSFSCWFFFLLRYVERVIGFALGSRYFPALNDQAAGAWLALFFIAVWVTRQHFFAVGKHIVGFSTHLNDADEPMSYRWAATGLVGAIAALAIFARFAGMQIWVFVIFFGLYFMLSFAITRVRAELGTPHEIYYVNPHDIMATVGGSRNYDPASLTIVSLFYWFNRGYRNHPMPNQIEAFKMGESVGMPNRSLWLAMVVAIVVGIAATFWANLDVTFRNGAVAKASGFKGWVGRESFNRLQGWLNNPTDPNLIKTGFMGLGGLLTLGMMIMRVRFLWWPFHPAGYALAISFAMDYFWFTFLVAWLLKLMILRHGGLQMNRRLTPFFLGLILGDYVIGSIWSLIGTGIGLRTYKIFI